MSDKSDKFLKRMEHLEKNFKKNFNQLSKNLHEISRSYFYNIYHYLAREIKNEAEIDLLKEYLIHTGHVDFRGFMEFKQDNPLMQTYVDENKNALKMLNFLVILNVLHLMK